MPITTKWWLEGRVIEVKIVSSFEVDDLTQAVIQAQALMDSTSEQRVHILVDNTLIGPTNAHAADMNREAKPLMQDERLGWVIVYGKNNVLTRFATNIVMQLMHPRFRMVNTLAEALSFLNHIDETLPSYEQWRQSIPAPDAQDVTEN